jgi:DNA mismatch endonuclease (patch repair protein)
MARNSRLGGRAEQALRSAIWSRGLRYRTHLRELPGAPDLVFTTARVVVFCDGDFWHGRNWAQLRRKLVGRSNSKYWIAKISYNIARDRRHEVLLREGGWLVLRYWETDVLGATTSIAGTIAGLVRARRLQRT